MAESITQANKAIVRRLYEDLINTGNLDGLAELIDSEFVGVLGEKGPSGFANTIAGLRLAFPDIQFTIEDMIDEGDRIAVRWTWRGTHQGSFQGFPASYKQVTVTGIAIYHVRGGKVVRAWLQSDRLGVLQQIGVVASLPELVARTQAKSG